MAFTIEEVEAIEWVKSIVGEDIDEYEALEIFDEFEEFMWHI